MMTRHALFAASLVLLAGCGSTTDTVYSISSGTYGVSGASIGTATPGDQCGLLPTYTAAGKQIALAVSGTTVTFDLAPVSAAVTRPSATINGNSIEAPVEASYTANLGNCVLRVRRTVQGDITANDETALMLHAQITVDTSGSDCIEPYVSGCQSDIHFIATKVP